MLRRTITSMIVPVFALILVWMFGHTVSAAQTLPASVRSTARDILDKTGVQGGLVVHIGCATPDLTAALCAGNSFCVQGLDTDAAAVARARARVHALGLYGAVSVNQFDGNNLPYIDNCVNLIVAENPGNVPRAELMRVLCPGGVAYVKQAGAWKKTVKPRPQEMDEWTHHLHDATNNAVAHDTVIDFPRHLQWVGAPKWGRHHDHMSSCTTMVSAGGRNFSIIDEGSAVSIQLPSKWFLVARDAFNGKILWKRPIAKWHPQLMRLKSGPAQLARRMVAIGNTVYATLSLDAPVTALNAATGESVRTYDGTLATEEILFSNGVLYLVVTDSPRKTPPKPRRAHYTWGESPSTIMAVNADTGNISWKKPCSWVVQSSLTVDAQRVLFFDGEKVVCLNRQNGELKWQSEIIGNKSSVPTYFGPTLVSYDSVVLFAGAETGTRDYHAHNAQTMWAFEAATGKTMWSAEHPPSGYRSPEDIMVINGLVWTSAIYNSKDSGIFTGRDLRTGEVKVEFPPDVKTHWFHHRCHRAKATDRYILTSRTGIEFVDVRSKHWTCHHWVRGACLYGIMPANGLIYTPPHPCACYLESKLFGFNALAATSPSRQVQRNVPDGGRLERGPAYSDTGGHQPSATDQWPTYRCDNSRSGYTDTPVLADLDRTWKRQLGGRLSALVIAEGKVFVAQIDMHAVHALDAKSGEPVWTYTAGARVDSPPTIWQGRVLFGSRDGYVYCLRASDGALVWRFRVAPVDRRLVAFERVESVWPVHGSVLVRDGTVWCAAGRSMFLDGGIRLVRLDVATGRKISESVFDDRDPKSGNNLQTRLRGLNMPVALPDILSCNGGNVYMRSQRFDAEGKRLAIETPTLNVKKQKGEGVHLFCPTGFLDDAYWHRSYWVYGRRWRSGAGGYYLAGRYAPAGRLLVFDDSTVYGFGRHPKYYKWTTSLERHLFASSKDPEVVRVGPSPGRGFSAAKPVDFRIAWHWSQDVPIYARGLILAGRTLFLAGPSDIFDEVKALRNFVTPETQAKLAEQDDILDGGKGSVLWVASAVDGRKLAEYQLEGIPVFDGLAAANGRLYLANTNGEVVCFSGK